MNFIGLSRPLYFSLHLPPVNEGMNSLNIWYLSNEAMAAPVRPESANCVPYKDDR